MCQVENLCQRHETGIGSPQADTPDHSTQASFYIYIHRCTSSKRIYLVGNNHISRNCERWVAAAPSPNDTRHTRSRAPSILETVACHELLVHHTYLRCGGRCRRSVQAPQICRRRLLPQGDGAHWHHRIQVPTCSSA